MPCFCVELRIFEKHARDFDDQELNVQFDKLKKEFNNLASLKTKTKTKKMEFICWTE